MSGEEVLYVYCIMDGVRDEKFGKIGIGGRGDEVYARPFKDLTAIVSRTDQHTFERNEENVLAHQRVVQKIFSKFAAVPLPFSTIVESDEELEILLGARYNEFRDKLEKLREIVQPINPEPGREIVEEALAQSFASALRIRQLTDEVSKMRVAPTVKPNGKDMEEFTLEVKSLREELQALRSIRESLGDAIQKVNASAITQPSPSIARSEEVSEEVKRLRGELDGIRKMQEEAGAVTETAERMLREIMDKVGVSERPRSSGATYA